MKMSDGRLYTGSSANLNQRFYDHHRKHAAFTTTVFGASELLYSEGHPDRVTAENRERQIKKWSQAKKLALASGDMEKLKSLSKKRKTRGLFESALDEGGPSSWE
jgi:putative endonuclease